VTWRWRKRIHRQVPNRNQDLDERVSGDIGAPTGELKSVSPWRPVITKRNRMVVKCFEKHFGIIEGRYLLALPCELHFGYLDP